MEIEKKYKLLRDNVLVRILPPEDEVGGIIIPERHRKNSEKGVVVAVGPGFKTKDATVEIEVKVGDTVLIEKHGISRLYAVEGTDLHIIRHPDIFAVITED